MTAAIICNGSISDFDYHRRLVKDCSLIICADGGVRYAKKSMLTVLKIQRLLVILPKRMRRMPTWLWNMPSSRGKSI